MRPRNVPRSLLGINDRRGYTGPSVRGPWAQWVDRLPTSRAERGDRNTPYKPRQACARVPYETSAEAKTALGHVRSRRGPRRKNERRTYKCRRCGKWHLTSMSK